VLVTGRRYAINEFPACSEIKGKVVVLWQMKRGYWTQTSTSGQDDSNDNLYSPIAMAM